MLSYFSGATGGAGMQFDVFISYAWGGPENTAHREWVRLLAAHLKQIWLTC